MLGLGLAGLPGCAAQAVQLDPLVFGTVTREKVDILNRQIQFCFAAVLQFQRVVRCALNVQGLQPQIARNTVVDVNHQVSGRQG